MRTTGGVHTILGVALLALLCGPTSGGDSSYVASAVRAQERRVQRIRLNGDVVYDAGRSDALPPTAFDAPHGERAMLLSGSLAGSELLGVVGPIAVQWSLAGAKLDEPHEHGRGGTARRHASVCVRLIELGASSPTGEVELAQATLDADARSWSCGEGCATLRPHARHTLRVALRDAEGRELTAAAVHFHAGPYGLAGDPAGGWTASWTGGASTVAAAIDLRPALAAGEALAQTTLHASSAQQGETDRGFRGLT